MSKTQQEIATPKVCKSYVLSLILSALFVVTLAAGLLGWMFFTRPEQRTTIVIVTLTVCAALAIIAFRRRFFVAAGIAEALVAAAASVIIAYLGFIGVKGLAWYVVLIASVGLILTAGTVFAAASLLKRREGNENYLLPLVLSALFFVTLAAGTVGLLILRTPVRQTAVILAVTAALAAVTLVAFRRRFLVAVGVFEAFVAAVCLTLIRYYYLIGADKLWQYVLVISALGLVLIGLTVFLADMRFRERKKVTTRYLTYTASLVALSVLCKLISNAISTVLPLPMFKLSINYLPWIIAGIVLGPVGGAVTAGVGDVLGQLIVPTGGAILPLTLISNILFPVFPALCYRHLPVKRDWLKLSIGTLISALICTMGLSTAQLYYVYGQNTNFLVYWASRLPQLAILAANVALTLGLLPALNKLKITKLKFLGPQPAAR